MRIVGVKSELSLLRTYHSHPRDSAAGCIINTNTNSTVPQTHTRQTRSNDTIIELRCNTTVSIPVRVAKITAAVVQSSPFSH